MNLCDYSSKMPKNVQFKNAIKFVYLGHVLCQLMGDNLKENVQTNGDYC